MTIFRFLQILLLGLGSAWCVRAADTPAAPAEEYRLFPRDLIRITVHDEPDVSVEQRVNGMGEVNLPLLGPVKVAGLTITASQNLVAKRYVAAEIFVHPEVAIGVVEYCPKEVMVLGQVSKQGKQTFPPEAASLSIVEAITGAGGLTRIAKGDGVKITRKDENGNDQSFTVNVERLIQGRASPGDNFMLQPGDVVFVPERVF
jgi:protein involved in polysaccharide export with SLBB domain